MLQIPHPLLIRPDICIDMLNAMDKVDDQEDPDSKER
jgi:hypothetical protein